VVPKPAWADHCLAPGIVLQSPSTDPDNGSSHSSTDERSQPTCAPTPPSAPAGRSRDVTSKHKHRSPARRRRLTETAVGHYGYAPLDAKVRVRVAAAAGDAAEGVRRWRSWTYLAVESVKNQYRRTVIGPWWLTIQTAAYVAGLAVLFGTIFHESLRLFVPYVAAGFIGFGLLAGMTRAGSDVFVNNASVIKSTRQPLSMLVLQAVMVEFLQFMHNLVIVALFLAFGLVPVTWMLVLVVPAVALMLLNGVALGLWLGPTVARFRDVGPFVASIMSVMVFFTPIFWRVDTLHPNSRAYLVAWNPFAYLLGIFRDPLLGGPLHLATYVGAGVITFANVILAALIFSRGRSRLPYWVA
jgi:ABC-2 type transport system permease protein